ncbi:MAG TPA: ABC transporter substrate-binding protein [Hyphomicrobiaceae bacterium]|nr:ABC transporter substrate-binding protein [Hyphomicrobiaceae bacterium]
MTLKRSFLTALSVAALGGTIMLPDATPALGQAPKKGGTLKFGVVAEPPTIDCHAATTFAMVHPVAPQYSTLLKFVGRHDSMKIVGDLAESYEMAKDGLTYTFKLRKGVKFHDGTDFTAADIKATYERIARPPEGVVSVRKAVHGDLGDIETPDAHTVVFKMKKVNASMLLHFASPFNCVYSAARLKADPQFPAKTVMGTGAFQFVEYQKGAAWKAKRFDGYFNKDRPYLDGYIAYFIKTPGIVPGLQGGQIDAEFRGRTPKERDTLKAAMGDKISIEEGPWITNIQLVFNTQKKPFDDVRVRKAITHAIDRWGGSENMGKVSLIKGVSGVFRPGAPYSLSNAELEKLPGFWKDITKARAEAKKLLAEAGVSDLKFKLLNRQIGEPFVPAGIYFVDQMRIIGVPVEHLLLETKLYFDRLHAGDFDMAVNNVSDFVDDPNAQFNTLLSAKRSSIAYSRHADTKIDELYDRQSGTVDEKARLAIVHELEKYIHETSYSIPLLWYQRIVVNHKKVKGWELHPSHFSGQSLVDVWLDE